VDGIKGAKCTFDLFSKRVAYQQLTQLLILIFYGRLRLGLPHNQHAWGLPHNQQC
jgi:hypothetical protein